MTRELTVHSLIDTQSKQRPDSVALCALRATPLTFRQLAGQIEYVVAALNSLGVRRNDRVAIVLPNGPEMAVAFLGVAAGATSAPLNPDYRDKEFDFYLSDLNAKAMIILAEMESPARTVAKDRRIPIIELSPVPGAQAGIFRLGGIEDNRSTRFNFAGPDDVALVLHTSGTTSRPKIVPLTHANICTSAANIRKTLALTESDRCLNVMPLFHIHGLIGATLSSLSAGASVACTPGFQASSFFEWMDEFRPTWYTAVPTMHQAILASAQQNREIIQRRPLRLIRSSSSALPPRVMTELENAFGAPVIESYGMTEASHQMASNPLPPRARKPGSVGLAAGPEVAIMDDAGNLLPAGKTGEVVIRGANVTTGYENNPTANAAAFSNGWFRTGDQGALDAEGYLSLTGRLKEIINRGGEKIAPREIDEVLLNHPGVRQAVAFAFRHPTLGEDIAAAVVPKDGQAPSELELREFALKHLSAFKVPSRIVLLGDIPKGPTGKLQRIGLADRLVKELAVAYEPPAEGLEQLAAAAFEHVLQLQRVGRNDNFFALGGDSIRAMQVVTRLIKALGVEIPPTTLFRRPTPGLLATELGRLQEEQKVELLTAETRADEIGSALDEIENMTDEQANHLLKQQRGDE